MKRLLPAAALLLLPIAFFLGREFAAKPGTASPEPGQTPSPARQERRTLHSEATNRRAIAALAYVDGTVDPQKDRQGVILNIAQKTSPGLNLYCSRDLKSALLLDMEGKIVHRWRFAQRGVDHCELLEDGSVIGLIQDRGLAKVDRDSHPLWNFDFEVHHSFFRAPDGRIWALGRRPGRFPELHPTQRIYEDLLVVVDGESGKKLAEISLLRPLLASPFRFLIPAVSDLPPEAGETGAEPVLDLLHANEVQVLDGSLASRSPIFAAGNLLVSLRNLSTLLILDPTSSRILWLWGPGNLAYQHHPTLLPNGHLLVFDNGTQESEVLELDPLALRPLWRYRNGREFFSATRGSCQRLGNGNTLITESNRGYVTEVTPLGEKVWEWANPLFLEGGKRAFVWRMSRYPAARLESLRAASARANPGPAGSG
ncbi:MAG: arylsulfotransferase family protein [Thermoanaerobaculia bacterium]